MTDRDEQIRAMPEDECRAVLSTIASLHPVVYDAVVRVVERERENSEEGSAVTLSWDDPESVSEFTRLRSEYRAQGWLPGTSVNALVELVGESKISTEEGNRDG